MNNQYCVILAGGLGTRLYPISRKAFPKQFVKSLIGGDRSLLQLTYDRYASFLPKDNIIVISNIDYKDIVLEQLPDLSQSNLLLEPMRRGTLPSAIWAAVEIEKRCSDAVMLISPCDQIIADKESFVIDIEQCLSYASVNADRLLVLGIRPNKASSDYGYLQMGSCEGEDIYRLKSFTEKPEQSFAQLFVDSGEFLFNTGMFAFKASSFLATLPMQTSFFRDIVATARHTINDSQFTALVKESFAKCPNISLEQRVLEQSDNVDVALCHFSWQDVGSFGALPKPTSEAIVYDCRDCIIHLPNGKIAVIEGLQDYLIADSDDVLLICKKDNQQAIRKYVTDVQLSFGNKYI